MGMPRPAIMMPVSPVARNSASSPRAVIACVKAKAVSSTQGTIGAYRQKPSARPLASRRNGDVGGRDPHVDKPATVQCRRLPKRRIVAQRAVHPTDDVEAAGNRIDQRVDPAWQDHPAVISDTDNEGSRAPCIGLGRQQRRKAGGNGASRQRELADAKFRYPITETKGGLGISCFPDISQEQESGLRKVQQRHGKWPRVNGHG